MNPHDPDPDPHPDRIQKLFEIYRDYVKHEDGLINFRVTWFVATQALVFAAYGLLAQEVFRTGSFGHGAGALPVLQADQPFRPTPWLAAVLVLCLLGALSAMTSTLSINAAYKAMQALSRRWQTIVLQGRTYDLLPALEGGGSLWAKRLGWVSGRMLPIVSFLVWCAIALAHLCFLPGQPPASAR
ncbi:MAG: hypothetical protein K2X43_17495 [Hyphomonadaceae bacterium]|jgi:hypothetical protein|nr:hypothetical protein [Hyphomonadaceae bacterium]